MLYARDPWSSRLELSHLGFEIVHSAHHLPDFSAAPPDEPLLVLPIPVLTEPPHQRYMLVILGLPAWNLFTLGLESCTAPIACPISQLRRLSNLCWYYPSLC